MDKRQYKQAAAMFDEVERQHPYSVWARRAQLMSSFSYYAAGEYTDSIASAQRFLSLHPGSREAPYAYYMIAVSYYEQISGVQRDQKITQQALDAFAELIRRYPNTDYAADARLKIDLARDHLAGKEMEIGRFYQRQRQYIAAIVAVPHRGRPLRHHQPHARGAVPAGRMLSVARPARRGEEGRRGARRQLSAAMSGTSAPMQLMEKKAPGMMTPRSAEPASTGAPWSLRC